MDFRKLKKLTMFCTEPIATAADRFHKPSGDKFLRDLTDHHIGRTYIDHLVHTR